MSSVRQTLRDNARLIPAALFVALIIAWSVVPFLFTGYSPIDGEVQNRLQPPSWEHLFGTDSLGRDVYTRVVYGSGTSLSAVAVALCVAFAGSLLIGITSGYIGGAIDNLLMRGIDILISIPAFLVSLMLVTTLGLGTINVAVAVGVGSIAIFSRVMRAEVLRVKTAPFVEAARHYGASPFTVLRRHIFPLARGPVLALLAVQFGEAILAISALSFLGFGAQPPQPEWGNLIAEGRDFLANAWWLTTFPGLVVAVAVLAIGQIGRAINVSTGDFN